MESGRGGVSEALKCVAGSLPLALLLIGIGLTAFEHLARVMLLTEDIYSRAEAAINRSWWLSGRYQSSNDS